MPIYTRRGDKGRTSLFKNQRVSKNSLRIEAIGTVDELNSGIGVAVSEISNIKYRILNIGNELIRIQNDLFNIGAHLANPTSTPNLKPKTYLQKRVKEFESFIDQMTEKMPPLKNFILPGGGKVGAFLHFVRTICRRAERRLVALNKLEKIDSDILVYVNRLSDLLFTMARFANFKEQKKEKIWLQRKE